jgi:hypothetical protein
MIILLLEIPIDNGLCKINKLINKKGIKKFKHDYYNDKILLYKNSLDCNTKLNKNIIGIIVRYTNLDISKTGIEVYVNID